MRSIVAPVGLGEAAVGLDHDRMPEPHHLGGHVADRRVRGTRRGHVLMQGAPHGDVEHLAAAADREQRDVEVERCPGERLVAGIGTRRHAVVDAEIVLAVGGRGDIVAAHEDQAVESFEHTPRVSRIVVRKQHWQPAGVDHRLRVLGAKCVQVGALVEEGGHRPPPRRHRDPRLARHRSSVVQASFLRPRTSVVDRPGRTVQPNPVERSRCCCRLLRSGSLSE